MLVCTAVFQARVELEDEEEELEEEEEEAGQDEEG